MKRTINKTKWNKIKKNFKRVLQTVTYDDAEGSVFVMQHYRLKPKEV